VADQHEVVRRGVRDVLRAEPSWQICAEAETGFQALARAIETRPNIVVIELTLPEIPGAEVTRRVRAALPNTEIIAFSVA
jgi:DNA-binding NarL/FixJ family response regulator